MKKKEQVKRIMEILSERLAKYGFVKKKYNYFVRFSNENIIQNIGIFFKTHGDKAAFYINASPGIVYKDETKIERRLRDLGDDYAYPDYVGAMYCLPISSLMPGNNYREWRFVLGEDVDENANDMADALIQYGIPFIEKMANRDEMIYGLEIGEYGGPREFTLPILLYLRGDIRRALEYIDEFTKKFSQSDLEDYEVEILEKLARENGEVYVPNNSSALNSYLKFADNFRKMLKEEGYL